MGDDGDDGRWEYSATYDPTGGGFEVEVKGPDRADVREDFKDLLNKMLSVDAVDDDEVGVA